MPTQEERAFRLRSANAKVRTVRRGTAVSRIHRWDCIRGAFLATAFGIASGADALPQRESASQVENASGRHRARCSRRSPEARRDVERPTLAMGETDCEVLRAGTVRRTSGDGPNGTTHFAHASGRLFANAVSANLRLRYNYRPDRDPYIIYNVGTEFASFAPANTPQVQKTRFATKYTYSWQR
jgi:hypothetical protein